MKSISIVFPVYNETKRLKDCFKDINKFNSSTNIKSIEYIFVDDGSVDNSSNLISKFLKKKKIFNKRITFKLIKNTKNEGKGASLKKGIKAASKEWILTIDTDISVSLVEINRWTKNDYLKNKYKIFFGSRNLKKSSVTYLYHRKFIGLALVFICKILFGIKLHDTQCGFKLYKKQIGKKIFKKMIDKKFAHDIEIVLLAKQYKTEIIELPVNWTHKEGSKIRLITDSFNIFLSLLKMKKNLISKN
jgi:dolichyl-phosphate beta-glucosyltransferase|tara:strand:- start:162 stop:899 length:738 start_codon:yes stop_codon:yes gene_type:complete